MVGGRAPLPHLTVPPLKWQVQVCSWRPKQGVTARKILGGKRTGAGKVLVNSPFSFFYIEENKDKIMEDVGMVVTASIVSRAIKDPKCKELQDGEEEKWHHGAVGPR